MNKINTYVGFAIKSRKVVFGADNILSSKSCKLVIASNLLAQNTLQKLQNKNIKIIVLPQEDFQLLNVNGLVIAITDKSLSDAIQNNF